MLDSADADRGTAPEISVTHNTPGLLPGPPEQYLRIEQTHRGYLVDERSMAFVFINGRLASASGRFAGTARFQAPRVDRAFLEAEVDRRFGDGAQTEGLIYNPNSGELELRVIDGEREHRLNALDGAWRSSRSRGHALEVTKNVNVYQFPSTVYLGVAQSTGLIPSAVSCGNGAPGTCDVSGTGTCRYSPRQDVYNTDRVIGVDTINSAGTITSNIYEDDPCGSTAVFNQSPWTSQYDLRHYAASARRILDEAADVLNHSESFFWAYPRTPSHFRLRVSAQPTTNGGDYFNGSPKVLRLYQDPSPNGRNNARALSTIAHEFGHYVHDTTSQLQGQSHVVEAWAATYALRMAAHRRFVSLAWPSVNYETDLLVSGFTWQLQSVLRKGEYILDMYPTPANCERWGIPSFGCPDWIYYGNDFVCPDNSYECGAPMWTVYWILVHDTCRLSFLNACTAGQDIIQHNGGYQNSAWRLANSTYAYAIANASGSMNLQAFMALVASRYAYFRTQGYLSTADENRVLAVMASQCLGPSQACFGSNHKLPGSPLPSSQTKKHDDLFREAEFGQEWYSATEVTSTNTASGNKYVSFGTTGWLSINFNITQVGTYRVHLVMKPFSAQWDEVRLFDPVSQVWKVMGPLTVGGGYVQSWDWRTETNGDADITFTSTGLKTVWFSAQPGENGFHLDAVWLEKL